MDKIKAFFQNKWTQLVAWILLVLSTIVLIIGGITAETISSGVALVSGIVLAVTELVIFICKQLKK